MTNPNRWLCGGVLALATGACLAQLVDLDPDWKEVQVPAPPALKTDKLLPLEMPRYLTTRFGVDADSIRVTTDGIVRYVMVTTAPGGSTYGSYEGIRCQTAEFKVYAKTNSGGQWTPVTDPQWRPLNANMPSQHALALARQGACNGRAMAEPSSEAIVRRLRGLAIDPAQR